MQHIIDQIIENDLKGLRIMAPYVFLGLIIVFLFIVILILFNKGIFSKRGKQ